MTPNNITYKYILLKEFYSSSSTKHSRPAAMPKMLLRMLSSAAHLNLRKMCFVRYLSSAVWVNARSVT